MALNKPNILRKAGFPGVTHRKFQAIVPASSQGVGFFIGVNEWLKDFWIRKYGSSRGSVI